MTESVTLVRETDCDDPTGLSGPNALRTLCSLPTWPRFGEDIGAVYTNYGPLLLVKVVVKGEGVETD